VDTGRVRRGHDELDVRVLSFVMEFLATWGYSPSLREIQAGCGLGSLRTAQGCIARLEQRGELLREPGRGRALRLAGPAASTRLGVDVVPLHLFTVLGEGLYPWLCTAAALAPTRPSAEGWLQFVLGQVRQVDAIRQALERARRLAELPEQAVEDVAAIWRRVETHVRGIEDWLGWVTQEEYWTEDLFDGGVPDRGGQARPEPSMVLRGNLETGRRSRQFVREELARLAALAPDRDRFAGRLAAARLRAGQVYAGVEAQRDRVLARAPQELPPA
jgi:hypothetical protein